MAAVGLLRVEVALSVAQAAAVADASRRYAAVLRVAVSL